MGQMPMFGGFGPSAMGMNDMNGMNMAMGFGGGMGGTWNGQSGMGGNFGAGYYPNAGYNQHQMHQGAYGNQMQNQQFQTHNYQDRFQGQRGGYSRGGRGGFGGRGGHHVNQFQGQNHHQAPVQYGANHTENTFTAQDGAQGDRQPSQAVAGSVENVSGTSDENSAMPVDESQPQPVSGEDNITDSNIEMTNDADGQLSHENGDADMSQGGDQVLFDGSIQQGSGFGGRFCSLAHVELMFCFLLA